MRLYHKLYLSIFYIFCVLILVYSYVLVDPNITFVNNSLWENLRASLVQFGYYQRELSSVVYIASVVLLFIFHLFFLKKHKDISLFHIVVPLVILGIFSYPLLSHDFFNYLFDAKIATFYHQNPYLMKALDFPQDPWLRFMHWTHRTYPYGPIFLPLSLIPSFLGFGKFFPTFLLFKLTTVAFYVLGVVALAKIDKKYAIQFGTHPLVIYEGLINSHNDLIALSLIFIGIFFLFKKKDMQSRIFLILSAGIKYLTFPFIFISKNKKSTVNKIIFAFFVGLLVYLSIFGEIQPWYFLGLLGFLPFYENLIKDMNIFFVGLLFSYFPYIRYGPWDKPYEITLKHNIILVFAAANIVYYLFLRLRKLNK